jgi:hypothetical protein
MSAPPKIGGADIDRVLVAEAIFIFALKIYVALIPLVGVCKNEGKSKVEMKFIC